MASGVAFGRAVLLTALSEDEESPEEDSDVSDFFSLGTGVATEADCLTGLRTLFVFLTVPDLEAVFRTFLF